MGVLDFFMLIVGASSSFDNSRILGDGGGAGFSGSFCSSCLGAGGLFTGVGAGVGGGGTVSLSYVLNGD